MVHFDWFILKNSQDESRMRNIGSADLRRNILKENVTASIARRAYHRQSLGFVDSRDAAGRHTFTTIELPYQATLTILAAYAKNAETQLDCSVGDAFHLLSLRQSTYSIHLNLHAHINPTCRLSTTPATCQSQ